MTIRAHFIIDCEAGDAYRITARPKEFYVERKGVGSHEWNPCSDDSLEHNTEPPARLLHKELLALAGRLEEYLKAKEERAKRIMRIEEAHQLDS